MELIHGGDIDGFRLRYGREPLDFSASLNPLGMPPAVRAAALAAVDASDSYPDPLCRKLTAAIATRLGVPETFVFCGNGSADVIYRLALAARPVTALALAPTFAEYDRAVRTVGCVMDWHPLRRENGFVLDDEVIATISPKLEMFFLCQPNNPTGRLVDPGLMRDILDACAAAGTLLVVDECYLHFVDEPTRHSVLPLVDKYPNLVVLDSFTKLFSMGGIRLGIGVSANTELIEGLAKAGPPWAVWTIAQAAGLAALEETDFARRSHREVARAKGGLVAGLEKLRLDVVGAAANFVFFRAPAADLHPKLAEKGFLIRDCGNFRGLEPGYYRVAVRRDDENGLLLRAMAEALEGAP